MDYCCTLGWVARGASVAHPPKSRHHRHCSSPESCRPLLPKHQRPTMSYNNTLRRADDRRGNYSQKTGDRVVGGSIHDEDDDDWRSTATRRPPKKRTEPTAIPTRNLKWPNLARYLELEFNHLKVQLPKDEKVGQSSGHVFPRPMTACRVLVRGRGGRGLLSSAANLIADDYGARRAFSGDAPSRAHACELNLPRSHQAGYKLTTSFCERIGAESRH